MAAANLTIDLEQLPGVFAKMGRDWNGQDLRKPLTECRVLVSADIKRNFDQGHDPDGSPWAALKLGRARGGDKPLRDRGILMVSAGATGRPAIDELTGNSLTMGTNSEYAAIHQHGGTIRPKSGKALAIPLTREAYRAGSPRNFGDDLDLVWPKGRSRGFLIETNRGRGKKNRGARSVMHYLLVSSVTIPARPFMGLGQKLADDISFVFERHSFNVLGGGGMAAN